MNFSSIGKVDYIPILAVMSIIITTCIFSPPFAVNCRAEKAAVTEGIANNLKGEWGQVKFNIRYRYEEVRQDGLETAQGDPIRLRLGYLTPKYAGLQDFYGAIEAAIGPVKLDLIYHDFTADEGGSDYGTEIDAKLSWKIKKHYTLAASYASYDADEYKSDTDKLWLELIVEF